MTYQSTAIDNTADYIDTRDVQQRIWYLEFLDDPETFESPEDRDLWADEIDELAQLRELVSELPGEANDGYTLVRETAFEDYARQYAEDIGAISSDATWPAQCIDWEQAADELRMDFTPVQFNGVTYYTNG